MARTIQESRKRPLAEELLFGKLANGGRVSVRVGKDGKLEFEMVAREKPAPAAAELV